jgi:rhodanese-related sulfurtransferase
LKLGDFLPQDLAWAAYLLVLAVGFGLVQQWGLVRRSFEGDLPRYLEKMQAQRRARQFQGVKTINLAQAYQLFLEGQTLFIDARAPEDYAELHIAGAVNLPLEKFRAPGHPGLDNFAKDRKIVVYCGEAHCNLALQLAEKLQESGFTQVTAFLGGFKAWDEAGYPADTSK